MAKIELTIPNEKITEFKSGFLAVHPVPLDDGNNPLYSELEWFKEFIIRYVIHEYKDGKKKLAREAAVIDNDVIE